jgi:predicted HTH domain antitoxin
MILLGGTPYWNRCRQYCDVSADGEPMKKENEWKVEHHARLYGDGKVTLAKAARGAGVSIWEMMDYVRNRKITAQYDMDDLEHDMKSVYSRH